MTGAAAIAERTLGLVGERADAEVWVGVGSSGLTRFANSMIHQNVAEDVVDVRLRVAREHRVAVATTTAAAEASLAGFVDDTIAMAAVQPRSEHWPGLAAATAAGGGNRDDATAGAPPEARAALVRVFVDAGAGMAAAGYCETQGGEVAFANSAGHRVQGASTSATLDGIHQTNGAAGSGHATAVALGDLDAAATGALAAQRARAGTGSIDIEPGAYEVVLGPEAVASIAVFLSGYGFNGKAHNEGRSFAHPGERQFDEQLDIVDDATDPRAVGVPFDCEGTPRGRLPLVAAGVTAGVVHDRISAAIAGTASTGHAAPGSEVWGAVPENVFVAPGATEPDALVAGVDRGLYVATFNYCRVLDPKTLVVTGLTRNGTFLIEDGEIVTAVTNLRFTQSFVDALAPGALLAVGSDARFADSESGPGVVHAPSMRLASWHFTGGAAG
jgi:predicted Zn-dependent protease